MTGNTVGRLGKLRDKLGDTTLFPLDDVNSVDAARKRALWASSPEAIEIGGTALASLIGLHNAHDLYRMGDPDKEPLSYNARLESGKHL